METFHIWFNLLMLHAGHVYWLGAWDSQEDCQVAQAAYEADADHAGDRFLCPFIRVEVL